MKTFSRILSILNVIITVISAGIGAYFLFRSKSIAPVSGYVLTEEFVKSDCSKSTLFMSAIMFLVAAVISFIGGLSTFFFSSLGERRGYSAYFQIKTCLSGIIFVITPVICMVIPLSRTNAVLHNEPKVIRCEFEHKYEDRDSDGDQKYYIVYSNGTRTSVSKSTYDSAGPGDYDYQVYFGGTRIRTYAGDTYTLPQ